MNKAGHEMNEPLGREVLGSTVRYEVAAVEEDILVRHLPHDLDVVAHEEHGRSSGCHLLHEFDDIAGLMHAQGRSGLIEDDDLDASKTTRPIDTDCR